MIRKIAIYFNRFIDTLFVNEPAIDSSIELQTIAQSIAISFYVYVSFATDRTFVRIVFAEMAEKSAEATETPTDWNTKSDRYPDFEESTVESVRRYVRRNDKVFFEARVAQVLDTLRMLLEREKKRKAHYASLGYGDRPTMLSLTSFDYQETRIVVRYWSGGPDRWDREFDNVFDKRDDEWWCDPYLRLE